MDYFASTLGYRIQKTLHRCLSFSGVGLHSGQRAKLTLHPARVNHGIVFERTDLEDPYRILAHCNGVVGTRMATTLGVPDDEAIRIGTVEHLLSALFAMGVTNTFVELDGPEVPILDGSSLPFVESVLKAGLQLQPFSTPILKILKPIRLIQKEAVCELLPRDRLRITASIDFDHPAIGVQTYALDLTPKAYHREVGRARTFGFLRDFEALGFAHLAQGASLENVLAFSEDDVLNPEGVRFVDECVRHKLLDALGDLALCGAWIEGELVSFRGGHSIHLALLKSLNNFRSHWEIIPAEPLKVPLWESAVPLECQIS